MSGVCLARLFTLSGTVQKMEGRGYLPPPDGQRLLVICGIGFDIIKDCSLIADFPETRSVGAGLGDITVVVERFIDAFVDERSEDARGALLTPALKR